VIIMVDRDESLCSIDNTPHGVTPPHRPLPCASTMELTSEQLARYQHRRLCPVDAVYLQMDARQILALTFSDSTEAHPLLLSHSSDHDALPTSATSLPRQVLADICVLRHHRLLLQELCHYWTYLTWVRHIGYDNAQFWDAVALVETYSTTTQEKPRQLDRTRVRTGVHVVSCLLSDIDTFRALLRCSNLPVRSLQEIPRQHIRIEQLQRLVGVARARRDSGKMIHTAEMKRLMGWTVVTKRKASSNSRRSKMTRPRGAHQQLHEMQESPAKRRKMLLPQTKSSSAAIALLPTEEGLQLDKPADSAERTGMAQEEGQTAAATTTTREMDVQCSEQQACTNAAIHLGRQTHNQAAPEDTADNVSNAANSSPAKDSESRAQAVSIDGLTQQQVEIQSITRPNVTSTTDLPALVMALHAPLLSASTKTTADQLSSLLLRLQSMVDCFGTSYVDAVTSDEVEGIARAMSGHVHHAELYHVFLIHIHTLLAVAPLAKNAAMPVWVTAAWPPSLLSSMLDKYADNHDIVLYSLSVAQRTRMFAHPHEALLKRLWKLHCYDVAIITLLTAIVQPLALERWIDTPTTPCTPSPSPATYKLDAAHNDDMMAKLIASSLQPVPTLDEKPHSEVAANIDTRPKPPRTQAMCVPSFATHRSSYRCCAPLLQTNLGVLQYQNRHMLKRLKVCWQTIALLQSSAGISSDTSSKSVTMPVEMASETTTAAALSSRPCHRRALAKSTAATRKARLLCDICVSKPRRKKEVAIKWCGHSMCRECASGLRKARNLHCPVCRVSVSIPNDLQLLVPCKEADLCG